MFWFVFALFALGGKWRMMNNAFLASGLIWNHNLRLKAQRYHSFNTIALSSFISNHSSSFPTIFTPTKAALHSLSIEHNTCGHKTWVALPLELGPWACPIGLTFGAGTEPGMGPRLGLVVTNGFLPSKRWFMATEVLTLDPDGGNGLPSVGICFVIAPGNKRWVFHCTSLFYFRRRLSLKLDWRHQVLDYAGCLRRNGTAN